MIACLAPLDTFIEENVSTLNYAARAAKINNKPTVNMDPKLRKIQEQKLIIEKLRAELKRAYEQIKFLTMGGTQNNNQQGTNPGGQVPPVQRRQNIGRQQSEIPISTNTINAGSNITINNNQYGNSFFPGVQGAYPHGSFSG